MLYPHKTVARRRAETSSFFTPNRHGYSVRFSPFDANCLVVATSQYFGFTGGGTLFCLKITPSGSIIETKCFEWPDGLFDVAWSEHIENIVVSASGDGSIQLWDIDINSPTSYSSFDVPKSCYREHSKEVCSVDWSPSDQNCPFLSASWDCSIKLWNPIYTASLCTYNAHSKLVYNAKFSNKMANVFASVSGDGLLMLWDVLNPAPVSTVAAHRDAEAMTCDWSKHDQNIIATGGSDGLIKGWDLRCLTTPLFELADCSYAVRRVQFSPFDANILASVSYDFSARIWDWQQNTEAIETIRHHSEFNYGLDWSRLAKNQLADCGWDSLVHVYTPKSLP